MPLKLFDMFSLDIISTQCWFSLKYNHNHVLKLWQLMKKHQLPKEILSCGPLNCVTFNVKFCWLAKALKVLAQVPKSNIRMCSALNDANFTLCLTGSQEPWGHAWLVRGGEDVLFPWYRPKRWWTFWSRSRRTFMRRSPVEWGRSGRPCLLHSLGVGHWFTYPQQPQGEDLAGRRNIV